VAFKMKKLFLVVASVVLSSVIFVGCDQPIEYSEKFDGIPIYPGMELASGSEVEERYEMIEFEGAFQDVIDYYLNHIDHKKWSVEENFLYWNEGNSPKWSRRYILTDGQEDVALMINVWKTNDELDRVHVYLNGSPLKEGKYSAEGQSKHWKASVEYILGKDKILVNGEVTYIGDEPPTVVDVVFLVYEMTFSPPIEGSVVGKSSTSEVLRQPVKDSRIKISDYSGRNYQFEIYKEAIDNAYIVLTWEEQGEDKIEIIDITVVP
jgi:hypothetical protein